MFFVYITPRLVELATSRIQGQRAGPGGDGTKCQDQGFLAPAGCWFVVVVGCFFLSQFLNLVEYQDPADSSYFLQGFRHAFNHSMTGIDLGASSDWMRVVLRPFKHYPPPN